MWAQSPFRDIPFGFYILHFDFKNAPKILNLMAMAITPR